jgi:hypothetical protein
VALAAVLFTTSALLTACGGGGGGSEVVTPTPEPAPTTVSQAVKVIDGAIRGATVCLDKNSNGLCDTGEPSATTAADGTATFTIPSADANKYPVLALVGTDAVDADHGPVTVAYSLQAPADRPAVVSPLSTLVVAQAAASNVSTADAEKIVRDTLGLAVSPLADFTASTSADSATAGAAARMLVVATQQQVTSLATAKDAAGNTLAKADVAKAIQQNLMTLLPAVASAVNDPAVARAANAAAKATALTAAATALNASDGLTTTSAAAAVAVAKLPVAPDEASTAPTAGLSLRWFAYTDAGNYNYRVFKATAAQSTTVNGKRQFTEYREQARTTNGTNSFYQQWGEGLNNWARNQTVWTGTEWFTCPTEFVHEATPWDTNGRSESAYCKANKSSNVRTARDISGLKMADVVAEIRAYPLKDTAGDFAAWGPDPVMHAARLQGTFPAGSKLHYYTGTDTALPDGYNTTSGDRLFIYNARMSAGNSAECNKFTATASGLQFQDNTSPTLEKLIERFKGTPCVFNPRSTPTGNVANEWWGQSTFAIGTVNTTFADTSGSAYFRDGQQSLRVSFGSGTAVNYWLCPMRASDSSPRNCTAAGTGSYSIETLGNGRVVRLANLPALAGSLSYTRTMVEHNGQIWYGFRGKPTVTKQIRPNLEATHALLAALDIPAPRTGAALTADTLLRDYTSQQGRANTGGSGTFNRGALAFMPNDNSSLVGAWSLSPTGNPMAQTFFFFADGSYVMSDPVGDISPTSCGGPGFEKGTYSYNATTKDFTGTSVTLDTNLCAGLHDTSNLGNNNGFGTGGTLTVAADGKSFTFSDSEGSVVLYRQTP